jgi:hypothetical protein
MLERPPPDKRTAKNKAQNAWRQRDARDKKLVKVKLSRVRTGDQYQNSANGPKRTSLVAPHMSAFGGKADMTVCIAHVCF